MAAALGPYPLAGLLTPPGYRFTGMLANPMDGFSYLAKMREAAAGAWLLHLPYTSEPHQPVFVYPQYLLLGKLAAITGLPLLLVYQAAQLLAGLFFLGTAYVFLASVISPRAQRRTTFLLLASAGGLSWLTSLWGIVGADAGIQLTNSFYSLFSNPHFSLAAALLLIPMIAAVRGGLSWRGAAVATLANCLLALLAPFLLVTQFSVLGLWAALRTVRDRRLPLPAGFAVAVAAPAALAAVQALRFYGDPILSGWTAQNVIPSPPLWSYAVGYGVLLPFAAAGAVAALRSPERAGLTPEGALLAAVWAVLTPFLVYLPVLWQRRLIQGYDIPLAVLAAAGLHAVLLPRLAPRLQHRAVITFIAVALLGNLWLLATTLVGAQLLREPHYITDADMRALEWLGDHAGRDEIVLASPIMANLVPVWSAARVYWGHPFETLDSQEKRSRVERFYSAGAGAAERCELLRDAGVTLVYAGPVEARLGPAGLANTPGFTPVFQEGGVTIYRVQGCMQP